MIEDTTFGEIVSESGIGASDRPSMEMTVVSSLLAVHFGLMGRIERIATEKDDTFRLRAPSGDFLVKISPPDEDPDIVSLQTAAVLHLEAHAPDLPIQRLVRTLEGRESVLLPKRDGRFPRVMRVLEFMQGQLLADVSPSPVQLEDVGAMLARVTQALTTFDHPRAERRLIWDLQNFTQMRVMCDYVPDPDHRSAAEQVFDRFDAFVTPVLSRLPKQVVHGDFSPHNVVVDMASTNVVSGVIDFGDVVRSAVVFDVSVPMANQLGVDASSPWSRPLDLLRGYLRATALSEIEIEVLADSTPARLLLRALVAAWQAERSPDRHRYLLTHATHDWARLQGGLTVPRNRVVEELHQLATSVRDKSEGVRNA
ncbi:hypothetical protein BVC93_24745 [Mycobacterium sp. MS1601]|uniref:phosphotransferase n=1 Tax=Mycobacterium sp. MS1601 TaxID=1936029 RepID=UPI0009797563|nr:phosphotransferase [Mycobacterium sp. MS1601]AQA05080.1 hypothetical protein BVC93_24745 [Mycobacterium sp. MS1601]